MSVEYVPPTTLDAALAAVRDLIELIKANSASATVSEVYPNAHLVASQEELAKERTVRLHLQESIELLKGQRRDLSHAINEIARLAGVDVSKTFELKTVVEAVRSLHIFSCAHARREALDTDIDSVIKPSRNRARWPRRFSSLTRGEKDFGCYFPDADKSLIATTDPDGRSHVIERIGPPNVGVEWIDQPPGEAERFTEPRWEVIPATEATGLSDVVSGPVESLIGYQVRWSEADEKGRYLWVGHYYAGEDCSLSWCENAALSHAKRFNEQKRAPWEFGAYEPAANSNG